MRSESISHSFWSFEWFQVQLQVLGIALCIFLRMEAESGEELDHKQQVQHLEMEYTTRTSISTGYLAWVCIVFTVPSK